MKKWNSFRSFALLCCLSSFGTYATEGGGSNYLPGFYGDFGMADFPKQGTYFYNFFAAYQDTASQSGTLLEMPGVIHVSGMEFLGGRYITAVFPGLLASKDSSGGGHYDRVGLGDFYFIPGGLNWEFGDLKLFLFEGIVAPTGRYEVGDFNTGRNYWTFDHNLLMTWKLPANNELSVSFGYMNNLKNQATGYRSGDEFHFDYMLGHYFGEQFGLGVVGSHYRQVTADAAPFGSALMQPGEASSIGPVVTYIPKINGKEIAVSLKWMREFNVSGRLPQEYLICKVFVEF